MTGHGERNAAEIFASLIPSESFDILPLSRNLKMPVFSGSTFIRSIRGVLPSRYAPPHRPWFHANAAAGFAKGQTSDLVFVVTSGCGNHAKMWCVCKYLCVYAAILKSLK